MSSSSQRYRSASCPANNRGASDDMFKINVIYLAGRALLVLSTIESDCLVRVPVDLLEHTSVPSCLDRER